MMPFVVAADGGAVVLDSSRFIRNPVAVDEAVSLVEEGTTISLAPPTRVDRPSKVTSAFSDKQERLPELKRARMTVEKRGIEKLV